MEGIEKKDALGQHVDAARACLGRLCPPAEASRRAAAVAGGTRRLDEYRAYLVALEAKGGDSECARLRGPLADRAFDAESELRVLLAEGIRSLNDLRDSGMLHLQLAEFARALESREVELPVMIRESGEELQRLLDLPPSFVDEVSQIAERRRASVRYDREGDVIVMRSSSLVDGEPEETRLRLAPRAGDMGRIGLNEFFGAEGRAGIGAIGAIAPTPPPGDCHQHSGRSVASPSIDAYAATLGGFAASREAMYRHARKVSQYGHGTSVQARDPVVTAAVVAGVALAVAVIAGIVGLVLGGGFFADVAMWISGVALVAFTVILVIIVFIL